MKNKAAFRSLLVVCLGLASPSLPAGEVQQATDSLWQTGLRHTAIHRFSTLFTAHDVRRYLADEPGLEQAIAWCKQTAVTKVYVESFRDGYQADRAVLEHARDRLRSAGLEVSGCVTTTKVGKPSTGWKEVACCYTDGATQDKLQAIFEFTAAVFDEIMIDDFWFTDCACPECDAARKSKTVMVGSKRYTAGSDGWADYRCELMLRLSQERLLGAARRVNPKACLIIKYPQWYDNFHNRGYDVVRETAAFDRIWVGTETRDYEDARWGGTVQYEAYFIMRWLGGIGAEKCGGGWFDSLGTTEATYVEQARQTILGGARESMLFAYGGLQGGTSARDVAAFRTNVTELLGMATAVKARQPAGIAAYKPADSDPGGEARIFDFVGMLGFPLVPTHEFPSNAPAAFFSFHALKNPAFPAQLETYLKNGHPVLLTDGLAQALKGRVDLSSGRVAVLKVGRNPKSLLELNEAEVEALRRPLLRACGIAFRAPRKVALYLFSDKSWVVENFNGDAVGVELDGSLHRIPGRGWIWSWK